MTDPWTSTMPDDGAHDASTDAASSTPAPQPGAGVPSGMSIRPAQAKRPNGDVFGARLWATTALQSVTPPPDTAPGEPGEDAAGGDGQHAPTADMSAGDDATATAGAMAPEPMTTRDNPAERASSIEDVSHQNGAIGEYVATSTRRISRGLGRGLAALLDDTGDLHTEAEHEAPEPPAHVLTTDRMAPSRFQPRRKFDQAELEELAQSMRQNGVLMPILVRPTASKPGHYEIIAGERRWRAAQMAGLREIPVVVRELTDTQALEVALIENIQRRDLTPLEEAQGYRRLMDGFGHNQEELADTVGKSRSHVANMLRLLNLPPEVQDMLQDGRLSASHGRALAGADEPAVLAAKVVAEDLNVRDTERLVQEPPHPTGSAPTPLSDVPPPGAQETELLARQLSEDLGLKVTIRRRGGRGSLKVDFTSLDQFADLVRRLRDGPDDGGLAHDV